MKNFLVIGGKKLKGKITVSGSKNATLPIMAAALLTEQTTILHNVPEIEDVLQMIKILNFLNVKTEFKAGTLKIDPSNLQNAEIPHELVCKMRASILLAGPILSRLKSVKMGYPGGCVLGKRSVDTHMFGFLSMGATLIDSQDMLHLQGDNLAPGEIILSEASVTGTENILMTAALIEGETTIKIAAIEPHVVDLCHFMQKMGVQIDGIGTHTLKIQGRKSLNGTEFNIRGDYLEAGTFLLAGAVTGGEVEVDGFMSQDLDLFLRKLVEVGFNFEKKDNSVKILCPTGTLNQVAIKTGIHPGFPTDLLAPFTVLLSLVPGTGSIFETLFEGRFNFLFELEKMGATINLLNPHQATITGVENLEGVPVSSCDIRAGAAIVLAALAAKGQTEISNINYIDRGYQNFEVKLKSLGADIRREVKV